MQRSKWLPYLYLAPAAILLLTFSIYPLFHAVHISLHTNWGKPRQEFAGLDNYRELLGADGEFRHSLGVSAWYVVGTVPVTLLLAFLIATLLFRKLRALGLFRTIYFLPYVTSTVAAAMVWRWIYAPNSRGALNAFLGWFGVAPQRWCGEYTGVFTLLAEAVGLELPEWAGGPSLALVSVMAFSVWHTLGFDVVIFLAGLSAIPREMHEAAEVDGANARQKMWHVTLPLLSPTLFFLLIISVIRSFQTFNQIYVLAPIERMGSAQNLILLIFNSFYVSGDQGMATAAAVLLFLLLLGLTALQMRVFGSRVHY